MSDDNNSASSTTSENRLYAGKYKTVDDLEAGYRSASSETQRVLQEKQSLEQKLADYNNAKTVPDDYRVAEAHRELEGLEKVKSEAKALGLTQAQFERYMQGVVSKRDESNQRQALLRAAAGSDDQLTQVKTYLTNQFGEKLATSVLDTMSADDFHVFAKKAETALSSSRSFGGGISTEPAMTPREKMGKIIASNAYKNDDPEARNEVIQLAQTLTKEKREDDVGALKHQLTELLQRVEHLTGEKKAR